MSTSSKKIFDFSFPNITYLIACNRCSLQYVEETVQKLKKGLAGMELVLANPVNMDFVTFY